MTATPSPDACAVYGDLVSEIAAPPADRKPIVTAWVGEERSAEAYERLQAPRRRAPGQSSALVEARRRRRARRRGEAERLRTHEPRGYRAGCVHGRLRTAERRAAMTAFRRGEIDVLVATTD
jgi:ATP-dependent DNA helicase RecG